MTEDVGNKITAGPFVSQRAYDNFVDSCIHAVSDEDENRWDGTSHGDGGGKKLDPPRKKEDKQAAARYGLRFTGAIESAYKTQGEPAPLNVQAMIKKINKFVGDWLY